MAQYRTMPCQIEAIQWTDNTNEIKSFCGNSCTYSVEDSAWKVGKGIPHEKLVIHTLEGDMVASRNDYIIKGLKGEFYPCKPDVFNQKYELINDTREMHMEQRWIPVSERLPEQPKENPVFDGKELELYLVTVDGDAYPFRAFWNGKTFTDGWRAVAVVAWMPLPEPYQVCAENAHTKKPQTNADRIRSMTDEELADFLVTVETNGYYDQSISGTYEMIEWLLAESEG